MMITRGDSEFAVTICARDGEWEGQIVEYNLSRVTPTLHLRHNWTSLEAALTGVHRRWQRLFPEEAAAERPDFSAAITEPASLLDDTQGLDNPYQRYGPW